MEGVKVTAICKQCRTKYDVRNLQISAGDPKWKYRYCSTACNDKAVGSETKTK